MVEETPIKLKVTFAELAAWELDAEKISNAISELFMGVLPQSLIFLLLGKFGVW